MVYALQSAALKKAYFNKEIVYGNTMFAHICLEAEYISILIERPIVDSLIGDVLLKDEVEEDGVDNDDDAIVINFEDRAIDWFRKHCEERQGCSLVPY